MTKANREECRNLCILKKRKQTGELLNRGEISNPALIIKSLLYFLGNTLIIFISAGTVHYWQGWVFCGVFFGILTITLIAFSGKKELIQERIKPGPGVKWWDKIFFPLAQIIMVFILAVSSLDRARFKLSPQLPIFVYIICITMMLASYFFIMWAMWTNNFFSSRVRIQSDRGQYVVQEGPYSFVRHPGYLGTIFWIPTLALVLGSLWGLIPAGLGIAAMILRTYLEDKMLQKELPGYSDYAKKVRFRLIPSIW